MYFYDKNGLLWKQENDGFRNVGVSVKEKLVTFKRIESIKVVPGVAKVVDLPDATPITIREAVSRLGISEQLPLEPIKSVFDMEV